MNLAGISEAGKWARKAENPASRGLVKVKKVKTPARFKIEPRGA